LGQGRGTISAAVVWSAADMVAADKAIVVITAAYLI